jgi:hypothetical protein
MLPVILDNCTTNQCWHHFAQQIQAVRRNGNHAITVRKKTQMSNPFRDQFSSLSRTQLTNCWGSSTAHRVVKSNVNLCARPLYGHSQYCSLPHESSSTHLDHYRHTWLMHDAPGPVERAARIFDGVIVIWWSCLVIREARTERRCECWSSTSHTTCVGAGVVE